ncbi:MAG: hypothetical protein AAF985_01255 [Bacteroidota bacterium]
MEHKESLLDVLKTLFRWKKTIIGICFLTGVLSIILCMMMDNYYQTATIFYAANHDLARPDPLGTTGKEKNYYGTGEDLDRILTIAESNEVADYLINRFNLYQHYDIDSTAEKGPFWVKAILSKNYLVTKTKYEAVELSVEDTDPRLAADIANAAREQINTVAQRMIKQSQKQQIDAVKNNIKQKVVDINVLKDSLNQLRETYRIYNPATQSRDLPELRTKREARLANEQARLKKLLEYPQVNPDTIMFIKARISGLQNEVRLLDDQIDKFNDGFSDVELIYRIHQLLKDQLGIDQQRLQQLTSAYESNFTAIHLIEVAGVPIVKSRPKRSILVAGSVFLAFLFSAFGVLLFDTYRDVNWREIING